MISPSPSRKVSMSVESVSRTLFSKQFSITWVLLISGQILSNPLVSINSCHLEFATVHSLFSLYVSSLLRSRSTVFENLRKPSFWLWSSYLLIQWNIRGSLLHFRFSFGCVENCCEWSRASSEILTSFLSSFSRHSTVSSPILPSTTTYPTVYGYSVGA